MHNQLINKANLEFLYLSTNIKNKIIKRLFMMCLYNLKKTIGFATFLLLTSLSNAQAQDMSIDNILKHRNAAHLLYIDHNGALLNPWDAGPNKSHISKQDEATYIDHILDEILAESASAQCKDKFTLTIFIHGGLNFLRDANERPDQFIKTMLKECHYPVFISWNSGAYTNYSDHLFRIRKGESNPAKAIPSIPIVLAQDLTRSVLKAPSAYLREIKKASSVRKLYTQEVQQAYPKLIGRLKATGLNIHQPELIHQSIQVDPLLPVKIITKTVTTPIIDGFGKGAWDSMLRRTDLIFTSPYSINQLLTQELQPQHSLKQGHHFETAIAKFFRALSSSPALAIAQQNLASVHTTDQNTKDQKLAAIQINLIGHSMGTLVVNQALSKYPDLNIKNIVYMGAAAPLRSLESTIAPWLQHHPNTHFYSLSLDPYNELSEQSGQGLLPRGSLLNWIDNIFSDIHSVKDRTVGSWINIIMLADDMFAPSPYLRERIHLTKFHVHTSQGMDVGPQQHGEFDNYAFWREEYWTGQELERLVK